MVTFDLVPLFLLLIFLELFLKGFFFLQRPTLSTKFFSFRESFSSTELHYNEVLASGK